MTFSKEKQKTILERNTSTFDGAQNYKIENNEKEKNEQKRRQLTEMRRQEYKILRKMSIK